MKFCVFIATSADGYIATPDGGVEWLETAGRKDIDMGEHADMGFSSFMSSIDVMVMGRKTMEKLSSFDLPEEQWPYGTVPIYVLSKTVSEPPANLKGRVKMYSGGIHGLVTHLESLGHKVAYVDGGSTISSFLKERLISEMIITKAPVVLGSGIPLFDGIESPIRLQDGKATAFLNDFIQVKYRLDYL